MECFEYLTIPVISGGRDRKGVDCWGLVYLIYEEKLGIMLPKYEDVDRTKAEDVWARISQERVDDWQEMAAPERREGDVILLRVKNVPWHVGIVLANGKFIHADPCRGVLIEKIESIHWKNRVVGYYRHPESHETSII